MNPPETAPKDQLILIDIGCPWLVCAVWNEPDNKWSYASLQTELYLGKCNDNYFETETAETIKGWIPLPEKEISLTDSEAIDKLNSIKSGCNEQIHILADDILMDVLLTNNHEPVVAAYKALKKRLTFWYA